MGEPRKLRTRAPMRVTVRVLLVPTTDFAGTWGPIVDRAAKRLANERAAQVTR